MARSFNLYLLASARVDVLTEPTTPTFVVSSVDTNNGSFASVAQVAIGQYRLVMDDERRYSPRAVIKIQVEGAVPAFPVVVRTGNGTQFDVLLINDAGEPIDADFQVDITETHNG